MNRYRQIVAKTNYGLFLAVAFLLPFPQVVLRVACVAWIVFWLLEGRWLSRPQRLRQNPMAIPFLLFGLWYVWRLLSGLWVDNQAAWAEQMERYLSFGLMVPVGIWGVNEHYDWRQAGKALVAGCVAAVVFYPAVLTLLLYHREIIDQLQWRADWNYGVTRWMPFFAENISHLKHRLFLCSIELFGMVVAIQVWKDNKRLLAVLLPVMLALIVLTGSRQSVLTCIGVLVAGVFCLLSEGQRIRYGIGIVALGMLIGVGLLKLHPRMQHVDMTTVTRIRDVSSEHDIRLNIWGLALQHPEDYLWRGLGAGQSTQYMVDKYEDSHYDMYAQKRFHSHNQYLEEVMELGLFGLLLYLIAWLSVPVCAYGKGRKTAIVLTTIFMLNMLTDCMFGKFCGIALWDFGLVLILLQSYAQRDQQSARDTQTH